MAVDTERGLMVPVIRSAHSLSLKDLSAKAGQLRQACTAGTITPDDLRGGTFTVTNLGPLGVELFTPVLNIPEVAILGVGNIQLKPVTVNDQLQFVPSIGLSLTVNHQAVDGAPAAAFLQALAQGLGRFELLLAA
jgi:pyruvate dehydrogenase E2 component (dihydrolipoamide acetyltransferase)